MPTLIVDCVSVAVAFIPEGNNVLPMEQLFSSSSLADFDLVKDCLLR